MKSKFVTGRLRSGQPQSGQSEEIVAVVREAFDISQGKFIRRASSKLDINATFIQRILRCELRLFSYKIHVVKKLKPQDYDNRVEMCETL